MLDGDPPPCDAALARRLRERLSALPLAIDAVFGRADDVVLPSYAGGPRPTSTVELSGAGRSGRGENVAWTADAHARFLAAAAERVPRGTSNVGALSDAVAERFPEPYDRAAIEAAAIDLALRQSGTTLARVAEAPARPVRYVVSLGRAPDPLPDVRAELAARRDVELKVDVDPAWDERSLAELVGLRCVVILDWKGSGAPAEHERLHRAFPRALLEDPKLDPPAGPAPWSRSLCARLAFDQPIARAADVARLPAPPVAINVKPARMGGVLEALDAIAAAARGGIGVYLGGMFEIGVGRSQLLSLAAVLCPDAPNDIAPIARAGAPAPRPARLVAADPGAPGF
ncbi:MAG TPA: hypothetical protein VFD92_14900 [Candidatus Binatia bacterium]|nr:hypothetical protein [Candidatus Binatia bacterium]